MMFNKKDKFSSNAPEFLIVGLGNPGEKYAFTRHNAGFLCLDLLAEKENAKLNKIKFKGVYGEAVIGGCRCILLKPQTFMNNSGESVREVASFYKIPPERILVIFDDISLPCGRLRIRRKGSDGGHNGIKSIIAHLNSDAFPRIKLGVGEKPNPEWDLADWVLSAFKKDELVLLREASDKALDAVSLIVDGNIDKAMEVANRR